MSKLEFLSKETRADMKRSYLSSAAAIMVTSPLEVVKMNAQVTSGKLKIRQLFGDVYRTHGVRGFYKGLAVSLTAQPNYWLLYLPLYNNLKKRFSDPETQEISFLKKQLIISMSSFAASMTVNPMFVLKTRFQTSALKKDAQGKPQRLHYGRLFGDILRKEGIRGLYKGNLVAQVKNTQMLIQMPLYDYLNEHPLNPLKESKFVLADRSFVSGVIAKTVASCAIFYPIDCIRTNLRDTSQMKTVPQVVKEIVGRPGGLLNLYRGVGVYWTSAVPTFGLMMYAWELFKNKV